MSRTHHHKRQNRRHWGEDLFSRRPCSDASYSSYNKKRTAKIERMLDRIECVRLNKENG